MGLLDTIQLIGICGGALVIAGLFLWAYLSGRKDKEAEVTKKNLEVSDAQKNSLANQPHNPGELTDKLRSGEF